jgi:hypothetical protein
MTLCFCVSLSAFAGSKLEALTANDLSILDDGVACWFENAKAQHFIYDDMSHAVIKLDGKVIKLNRHSGDWKSAIYSCGKTYEYVSEDNKVTVSIKMKPGKADMCPGEISAIGPHGKSQSISLKFKCGD